MTFNPALIVVDMQHDFCPPDGSLAVKGGRDIIPLINSLLRCPTFSFKVATRDWHPADHMSFASNHPPPNNKPFESFVAVGNIVADRLDETYQQRLWPVHCVQGTKGAEFVDGLEVEHVQLTVLKGVDHRIEMYSAFSDAFGNVTKNFGAVSHDLAQILHDRGITHVYVVGLAGGHCVKETAIGAARAGFTSYVIEEGQRGVDPDAWGNVKRDLAAASVQVVQVDSDEVLRLGKLQ